jgi:hypothetical protein
MFKHLCLLLSALALGAWSLPALADSVTYQVTINTTSAVSTDGYIDLELNPNSASSSAISASVFNFSGATVTSYDPQAANGSAGSVSGSLPGSLSFTNSSVLNDYTQSIVFGTDSIVFDVTLTGVGVVASDGSDFQVAFYDDSGDSLFTSDPSGIAGVININTDGSVTPDSLSSDVSIAATPEPGTLSLFGLGGLVALLLGRRAAVTAR